MCQENKLRFIFAKEPKCGNFSISVLTERNPVINKDLGLKFLAPDTYETFNEIQII